MAFTPIRIVIAGVDKFTSTIGKSLQGFDKIGKRAKKFGRTMTMAVTLPVLALGASAISTAANFETSMNRVQNLTGATGKQLGGLENQARELGATTQFSATQAAKAMGFLGMAGFETNEIFSSMPATLNLAAAAQIELGTAADIVSNVMTGYNKKATETDQVTNILVSTFQGANTNLEQLGEAMKYVAPLAAGLKIPIEDTATAIGLLGNAGMQGSMAGTQLRGVMAALVKPTSEAARTLAKLKIQKSSIIDAKGNITSLRKVIEEFTKSGANSTDILTIFGRRMGPGMAALMSQGVKEFDKLRGKLNSQDSAVKAAEVSMKGLNGQIKALLSAFDELKIAILKDTGLLTGLTKVAGKFATFIRRLAKTSPHLLKMAAMFAMVVAAVGPLVFIIGQLLISFAAIGGTIASAGGIMALLLNPVGLVIAGIVALVALLRGAGLEWGQIFSLMLVPVWPLVAIVQFIIKEWSRLLPFFKLTLMLIIGIFRVFGKVLKVVLAPVLGLLDKMMGAIKWVMGAGLGVLEKLAGKVLSPELQSRVGFVGGGVGSESAALQVQGRIEKKNTRNESELKVRFENAPKGMRVEKEGSGPFDFGVETGSLFPAAG